MKIDVDPNGNLYDEACRLTGMCCLLMARDGEEINRSQFTVELMRLPVHALIRWGSAFRPCFLPLRS